MARNYTKVEHLSAEIFRRKSVGETNRQIAESYHLSLEQVKGLITRQNRKARLVARGTRIYPSQERQTFTKGR